MPTPLLPAKPRAKVAAGQHATDWLAVWALSVGLCALALAAMVYCTVGDAGGASMILAATAAIIATMLHLSRRSAGDR
jgi:hypothetical protein